MAKEKGSKYDTHIIIDTNVWPQSRKTRVCTSSRETKEREQNNDNNSLVSVVAHSRRLVVLGAIVVRAVVERSVPLPHRSAAPLVVEVPVKASEGAMLRALVLQKRGALFHSELLEIPAKAKETRRSDRRRWRSRRRTGDG